MDEKLLNLEDAAKFLSLSVKEITELSNEGKIPAFHLGGKFLRFRKEDLLSFHQPASKKKEETVELYSFRDGIRDFFYFNDFYLLSILVVLFTLFFLFKG